MTVYDRLVTCWTLTCRVSISYLIIILSPDGPSKTRIKLDLKLTWKGLLKAMRCQSRPYEYHNWLPRRYTVFENVCDTLILRFTFVDYCFILIVSDWSSLHSEMIYVSLRFLHTVIWKGSQAINFSIKIWFFLSVLHIT